MDLQAIIQFLSEVEPVIIYLGIFFIAYIENIFPPSPSDVVIVFGGSMVAVGKSNFFATLFFASMGSMLGFITMYLIGKWFGRHIIETRKYKFIPVDNIHKIEKWFIKYGYAIIVANRFLAGTRAIVSFFAGISEMNLKKTAILSLTSAVVWNVILLYSGYVMGRNWQKISEHLETYWMIVTSLVVLVAGLWLIYYLSSQRKKTKNV